MITEEFDLINPTIVNYEGIKYPELNEEEKHCIHYLVEMFRHIIEIDNLFEISNFNLMSMVHYYELYNTSRIKRNFNFEFETTDHIAINALVNNIISSGKTLLEAIDVFMKEVYKEEQQVINNFKAQYTSKKYDDSFQYRLLLRMRDFAQHGHLPINVDNNSICCIDLNYITSTPHFEHNKNLYNQMKDIINEIQLKLLENPQISFSISIIEYKINISEIYNGFLNTIECTIQNASDKLKKLLLSRPDLIYKSENFLNGQVIYKLDDDNYLHMFNPKGETMNKFHECKKNAKKIYEYEKQKLDIFYSNTMTVPIRK